MEKNGSYVKTEGVKNDPEQRRIYNGVMFDPTSYVENVTLIETADGLVPDLFNEDMTSNGRAVLTRRVMVGDEFADTSIDMPRVDYFIMLTRNGLAPAVSLPGPEVGTGMFLLGETTITSAADPDPSKWGPKRVSLLTAFTEAPHGLDAEIMYQLSLNAGMQYVISNTGSVGYQEDASGNVINPGQDVRLEDSGSFLRALARGTFTTRVHPKLGYPVINGGVTDLDGDAVDVSKFLPDPYYDDLAGALAAQDQERVAFLANLNAKLRTWKVRPEVLNQFGSSGDRAMVAEELSVVPSDVIIDGMPTMSVVNRDGVSPVIAFLLGEIAEQTSVTRTALPEVGAVTTTATPYGGIDLANMDLKIKRDGNGVPLPVNMQNIEAIQRQIEGVYPVIINVVPAASLPVLMGFNPVNDNEPTDFGYDKDGSDKAAFNRDPLEKREQVARLPSRIKERLATSRR